MMQLSEFETNGALRFEGALRTEELARLRQLFERRLGSAAGVRLSDDPDVSELLGNSGTFDKIARSILRGKARPVRAILFDKTPENNWALGWHQDRTVAVRERIDAPGFGPWSKKAGILHVEPPFELIERMVTLRAHLDSCGPENAPLLIAKGSHRLGRVPSNKTAYEASRLETLACIAKPGDVWAYRSAILHASEASREKAHRRVLHVDYADFDLMHGLEWLGV